MSVDLKVEKPREFRISPEELSELSFDVQNMKVKQIETKFWEEVVGSLQHRITKRLALEKPELEIDWSQIFPDGILLVRKKAVPKIEVKPVEAKKNDNNIAKAAIG